MKSDPVLRPHAEVDSDFSRVGEEEILDGPAKDAEGPLPLRALLTRPVVVSVANYGMISLIDIMTGTLLPLVWSTSVEFGGLSMSPASIGLCIAGYGISNCIFQVFAFPPAVKRFGPRRLFITCLSLTIPVYILFPFENLAMRHSSSGLYSTAGLLIVLQLLLMAFYITGFGEFCAEPSIVRGSLMWFGS